MRRRAAPAALGLAAALLCRSTTRSFSAEQFLLETAPVLDGSSHKGQGGRVGVLGGSEHYTGAPYYAGMAALRTGAELVYVFTAKEAAMPIKSYSPELMVMPVYSMEDRGKPNHVLEDEIVTHVQPMLGRLHALVVGCGLGRHQPALEAAKQLCARAAAEGLPVVLDADGLQVAIQWPKALEGMSRTLLTPNAYEFRQLCQAVGLEGDGKSQLVKLCEKLDGPAVLLKGEEDLVADASGRVECCSVEGTPRRSGGYGDVLAGTLGTLLAWSKNRVQGCSLPMDFIGKTERAEEHWAKLFAMQNETAPKFDSLLAVHSHGQRDKQAMKTFLASSAKYIRALCWLYLGDFAVFEYELPNECQEEPMQSAVTMLRRVSLSGNPLA